MNFENKKKETNNATVVGFSQRSDPSGNRTLLDTKAKELETNQHLLDAGEKGIAESPILQGGNQVRDFGTDLALSGAQDIARVKETF